MVITSIRLALTEAEATHKYPTAGQRQFGKWSKMRYVVAQDDWAVFEAMRRRNESLGWGSMFRRSAKGGWKCCADFARNPPARINRENP